MVVVCGKTARKSRGRQAKSWMPGVRAAQNKLVQNLKEENTMKPSTQDQTEGTFHEVKGKIKEKVGRLTNNPNLEGEGFGENIAGKVQNKIGQVQKVVEKP